MRPGSGRVFSIHVHQEAFARGLLSRWSSFLVSCCLEAIDASYPIGYDEVVSIVRDLRIATQMTQSDLAEAAGTSQPTIAAYEADRKSPTLRTLDRLARAVGQDVVISFVPALTREDRRSLHLHRAIAEKLRRAPQEVLERARTNARRMKAQHRGAQALLGEWLRVLEQSVDEIVEVIIDPGLHARDLRQVTPFAGVLTAAERSEVYMAFAHSEEQS